MTTAHFNKITIIMSHNAESIYISLRSAIFGGTAANAIVTSHSCRNDEIALADAPMI
jgi:hypothetical protein